MDDLKARLRDADRGSVQRALGSRIFGEAADRIEKLEAENARLREALRSVGVEADVDATLSDNGGV